MFRPNALKALLAEGGKALGCWSSLDDPAIAEILALSGLDFVLVDHEHGLGDPRGLAAQFRALSGTVTTSLVRVPSADPVYVKRVLDAGAESIMFPGIDTADEARAAVRAARYAPEGERGLAPGMIRASSYGFAAGEYVREANAELLIVCQIETPEAVSNIEEIASVDGVDVLFIGPNDLSSSVGRFWQFDHEEVRALIADAERRILATGKPMGAIPYPGRTWKALFDSGHALVTGGSDVSLLREAAAAAVAAHRGG